jgi:hypothetical protein
MKPPSPAETRLSLTEHAAAKGQELRGKYGPAIGWKELQLILQDRALVRYPTEVVFEAEGLMAGELAYPQPKGERPEEGYRMCVHPLLALNLEGVVPVVLYQLVVVNYGGFASAEEAEVFGANALGLTTESYYERMCEIAGEVEAAGAAQGTSREQEAK